jgi:hypothetical protein
MADAMDTRDAEDAMDFKGSDELQSVLGKKSDFCGADLWFASEEGICA